MEKEELAVQFPEEEAHLRDVEEKIDKELKLAEETVGRMDKEQKELLDYMKEHSGEIDPKEMFQAALIRQDNQGNAAVLMRHRDQLRKTKDSPYFARIDFLPDRGDKAAYYIGMYAFRHQRQLEIIDWRSPVAGMFYDFETGPAFYTTPATLEEPEKKIEGSLTLKRQFKISGGELEFAFDSSQNIQDDILQRELAHTSDEKMKSIISTIQKEQNAVIRDEKAHTMIIQGVAGSGKTSIALHRVAFLLYRFRNTIKAENITIISPNKVFGSYISGVLPELGEEPIFEAGMEDLALVQLEEGVDFVGERSPLETEDKAWEQRVQFKATTEFVARMDEYIGALADTAFEARDYVYGEFSVPARWIKERVDVYQRFPLIKRLEQVAEDIESRLSGELLREEKPPKLYNILQALRKMLKFKTTLAIYKDFYRSIGQSKMYKPFQKGVLEWNDVYPYLYLQAAFTGLTESRLIKHLVIDEMQDYTPIQYAVLNRLFQCPKTILGDFGQSIDPNRRCTLEELHGMYPGSQLVRLEKSYRSTWEIIHFAKSIVGVNDFEAIERHGDAPSLLQAPNREKEVEQIAGLVEQFHRGAYNALGIVTRTNHDAQALYDWLKERDPEMDVELITPESKSFHNGAVVLSVQMSKGLEFDQVVVPFADEKTYRTEFDRNLLYVACTRAMHKLTLTCAGEVSGLIKGLL